MSGLGSQFCPHELCDLGQILNLSGPHMLPQVVKWLLELSPRPRTRLPPPCSLRGQALVAEACAAGRSGPSRGAPAAPQELL